MTDSLAAGVRQDAVERFAELLVRALPEYGVALAGEQVARLARHLAFVVEGNRRVRLVGDPSAEVLVRRHCGESLFLLSFWAGGASNLVDVGSGAGFPGVPLAIARDWINTTFVESSRKKAGFLRELADFMELGAEVRTARLEEQKPGWARTPALWTARALDKMETYPRRLLRQLQQGDQAAFWVTTAMAESWKSELAGWRWQAPVLIPGSRERVIVVGEKEFPANVPRGT